MNIIAKIKNLIKISIIKSIKDDADFQKAVVECFGVERNAVIYSPFGLYSNPEDGCFCVTFAINGNEDSLISFPTSRKDRLKLQKNEVALWNKKAQTGVKLLKDKILVEGFGAEVKIDSSGNITISGTSVKLQSTAGASIELDELGGVALTGVTPVTIDGLAFITHLHPAGTPNTGAPIAPPAP